MQQRNNHIKPLADPELIRRYLAGELDDKAMHALERQALDDPFLAEALEGFELHAPDQRMQLADLDKRLAKRVAPAKRKVIPLYLRWAAAAAVCGMVGSSIIWLWPAPSRQDIAKLTIKTDTIIPSEVPALVHVPESVTVTKPVPLVAGKEAVRKKDAALVAAPAREDESTADVAFVPTPAPAPAASKAEANVSADTTTQLAATAQTYYFNNNAKARSMPVTATQNQYQARIAYNYNPKGLTGRILNAKGDSGITGVTVSLGDYGTTTDDAGYFKLPVQEKSADKQLITASAPGYQSQSIIVKSKSAFVKMQLRKSTDTSLTWANIASSNKPVPVGGFDQFEKYLASHVQYPTGLTISGKVRVSFLVQEDGTLTDFKVIKKLQPACDDEAIRVIRSGPAWMPASGEKATRVKVDVMFSPTDQ
jgi:TonB family protein